MFNLLSYFKAGYPLLHITTHEESRAELMIRQAAIEAKKKIFVWSTTDGLRSADKPQPDLSTADAAKALTKAKEGPPGAIYVFRDLHAFYKNPLIMRHLRDIATSFKQVAKHLVVVSPSADIPSDLQHDIVMLEFELPTAADISIIFDELVNNNKESLKKNGIEIEEDEKDMIIQAAMGLTNEEAESAFAMAIIDKLNGKKEKKIVELVMSEKAKAVRKSGILQYFDTAANIGDIGGLEVLKSWLKKRTRAFTKAARDFKLPYPKGILLMGLPGCGKSLSAKATANILGVPLIRFDIGRVFGGLVGASESNMRLAIQTIEAVGQCVVHIDELEKALAGSDGHGGDGGVTRRILGNFLEWTQEHTCPAFIVATMNSRIGVPPELLRRGRWDQLFFIGPPSLAEREAIFKIHIYKRGRDWRDLSNFNINELAKATDKFSGAEIEAAVIDGMYNAFDDGKDLRNEHILQAIRLINPLARSSSEELEAMVQWSKENAINASECEDENSGRKLDV